MTFGPATPIFRMFDEAKARELYVDFLGFTIDWWLVTLAFAAIVGLLGYRDIEVSAKVLGVALVLGFGLQGAGGVGG